MNTVKCPFCAGEVEPEVKKCRHCGEWLKPEARPQSPLTAEMIGKAVQRERDNKDARGCLWLIVLFVIAYFVVDHLSKK